MDAGPGTGGSNTDRKHVVLQLEAESLSDTQRLVMLLRASILVGIAALIFQTVYKVCPQHAFGPRKTEGARHVHAGRGVEYIYCEVKSLLGARAGHLLGTPGQ